LKNFKQLFLATIASLIPLLGIGLASCTEQESTSGRAEQADAAYKELLAQFSQAPALEARLLVRGWMDLASEQAPPLSTEDAADATETMTTEVHINLSLAKPLHGQMQTKGRFRWNENGEWIWKDTQTGLVGNGEQLVGFDALQKTRWVIPGGFPESAASWMDLDPLRAWAGITLPAAPAVWLDAKEPRTLRVQKEHFFHDYTINEEGAFVKAALNPTEGWATTLPHFTVDIEWLRLPVAPVPQHYAANPPTVFELLPAPPK